MEPHATPLVTKLLPLQPLPREEENFHRGGKYFKHVYQPLAGFEPTILLITLFIVRRLSYLPGDTTLQ